MRTLALLLLAQASSAMALSPAEADTLVQRAHWALPSAMCQGLGTVRLPWPCSTPPQAWNTTVPIATSTWENPGQGGAALRTRPRMDPTRTREEPGTDPFPAGGPGGGASGNGPHHDLGSQWEAWTDGHGASLFTWACVLLLIVALVPGRPRGWERSVGAAAGWRAYRHHRHHPLGGTVAPVYGPFEAIPHGAQDPGEKRPTEQAKVLFVFNEGAKLKVLQVRNIVRGGTSERTRWLGALGRWSGSERFTARSSPGWSWEPFHRWSRGSRPGHCPVRCT